MLSGSPSLFLPIWISLEDDSPEVQTRTIAWRTVRTVQGASREIRRMEAVRRELLQSSKPLTVLRRLSTISGNHVRCASPAGISSNCRLAPALRTRKISTASMGVNTFAFGAPQHRALSDIAGSPIFNLNGGLWPSPERSGRPDHRPSPAARGSLGHRSSGRQGRPHPHGADSRTWSRPS